jgi:hypothetical protein
MKVVVKQFFPAVLILVTIAGCSEKNPFGTARVTGIVKIDGNPISEVTLSFQPVSGDGMTAVGLTDANGKFVLTTGGAPYGSGAVPGEYNVTFFKQVVPEKYKTSSPEEFMQKFGIMEIPYEHPVPLKYNSPKTSGMKPVSVEKRGKNDFEFLLNTTD